MSEVVVPEDHAVGSLPIPFYTCKSTYPGVWLSNLTTPSSRTTLPTTLLTHSELFMVSDRLCAWQLKERQRAVRALSHPVLTASAPSQEHSDIYRGPSLCALSSVSPCPLFRRLSVLDTDFLREGGLPGPGASGMPFRTKLLGALATEGSIPS